MTVRQSHAKVTQTSVKYAISLGINFFGLSGRKNLCRYNVQKEKKKISILPHFNAECLTSCFVSPLLYSWIMPCRVRLMVITCHRRDGVSYYRSPRDFSWLMCSAGSGGGHQSVRSPSTSSTTYSWKILTPNMSKNHGRRDTGGHQLMNTRWYSP
jgi:hypothetical protein